VLALYDLVMTLAVWLVLAPLEVAASVFGTSRRRGLAAKLGRPPRARGGGGRRIVVHAVSVGEMAAAGALVRHWAERHPSDRVLLTAGNRDGLAAAERLAAEVPAVVAVAPLPWDRRRAVRRWLRGLAPDLLVVVESEIWPRLYLACRELGVPLALVSARVYAQDVGRYRMLPRLFRRVLAATDWIGVQSGAELERWLAIGAPRERVEVVGNLKYDVAAPVASEAFGKSARGEARIVAASTHPGEEILLLRALESLPAELGTPRLLLAPRHPRRARAIVRAARRAGYSASTLSALERNPEPSPRVVVVDRFGWLPSAILAADLVVLGGTFARRGGQNPLEAARAGRALIVGPSTENFAEVIAHLRDRRALCEVATPEDLAAALAALLRDPAARERLGARAAATVAEGRCVDRYARRLEELLARRRSPPEA